MASFDALSSLVASLALSLREQRERGWRVRFGLATALAAERQNRGLLVGRCIAKAGGGPPAFTGKQELLEALASCGPDGDSLHGWLGNPDHYSQVKALVEAAEEHDSHPAVAEAARTLAAGEQVSIGAAVSALGSLLKCVRDWPRQRAPHAASRPTSVNVVKALCVVCPKHAPRRGKKRHAEEITESEEPHAGRACSDADADGATAAGDSGAGDDEVNVP